MEFRLEFTLLLRMPTLDTPNTLRVVYLFHKYFLLALNHMSAELTHSCQHGGLLRNTILTFLPYRISGSLTLLEVNVEILCNYVW